MDKRKERQVLVVPIPMNRTTPPIALPVEVVEVITVVPPRDPIVPQPVHHRVEDARIVEVLLAVEVVAEEDNS